MEKLQLSLKLLFLVLSLLCHDGKASISSIGGLKMEELLQEEPSQNFASPKFGSDTSFSLSSAYLYSQSGRKENDKIQRLPGQPDGVDFNQYSGYVTVDPNSGRALFYYFVESPRNSSSNPLVLWLNGGPGCSSLGAGALTELGPFRVEKGGKILYRNQYAWNADANIIFLESPAGVGFSYTNTTSDYDFTGDERTAVDTYTFLVNWLERFPEYKTRDFFIAGESYAGHYVPQLAQVILHANTNTNHTKINLKGIAVGNGLIDYESYSRGWLDYYWTHALISDEMYIGHESNCNFSSPAPPSDICRQYQDQVTNATKDIYSYDIFAPLCNSTSSSTLISVFDPCSLDYAFDYLNNPAVQIALHVDAATFPYPWELCNLTMNGSWKDRRLPILPIITELMESGIPVWIYSGDTDGAVPVTSSRYAINKLGISVKTPWYPWYLQNEVGGYVVEYENLMFVTIRGSGHFVPSYQPARALALFSSFCYGSQPLSEFLTEKSFKGAFHADSFNALSLRSESDASAKAFAVHVSPQDGLKEKDKIDRLPGQPDGVDFNQFSGYVKVDCGRVLYYYFVESPQDSSSKPLLMWFAGVPGCSSFGVGAWTEIGPFRVNKDGKTLYRNPYAWNSEANLIFVEAPAGVGFSYSNTSAYYERIGDTLTAYDTYTFLVNRLERFPEYKNRDLFLAGESYAGHYATQLAQLILRQNKYSNQTTAINLKGVAHGNSYIDHESSFYGSLDYAWRHALISDEIYNGVNSNCNLSLVIQSDSCSEYLNSNCNVTEGINPYDIYASLCNSTPGAAPYSYVGLCSTDYVSDYMENPEVQIALHANISTVPYPWKICNGDTDSAIPVTSAKYAVNKLKLSVKTAWYPWYLQNEVGGYVVEYQNLTFVTVRGAGLFVPDHQPARALALFTSFINAQLPPST
nr:uncharacterized protein LOC113712581 [Coffea arabica]